MKRPTTLLVGHDFSKRADRALRRAIRLSAVEGRIVVFHAASNADALEASRDQLSSRIRLMLAPQDCDRVPVEVHSGAPETVAARLAQTYGADLLLLGLHGKTALMELLATNTMVRMISALPVPTLIATVSPPMPYRRILVGMDFAQTSADALALTSDWFPHAEIMAVHAFDLQLGRRTTGPMTLDDMDEGRRAWLDKAVAAASRSGRSQTVHPVLRHGAPAATLRKVAEDDGCDLIVLGRHNRGWLIEAILGSVARRLLAAPPCDVLVVPPSRSRIEPAAPLI